MLSRLILILVLAAACSDDAAAGDGTAGGDTAAPSGARQPMHHGPVLESSPVDVEVTAYPGGPAPEGLEAVGLCGQEEA